MRACDIVSRLTRELANDCSDKHNQQVCPPLHHAYMHASYIYFIPNRMKIFTECNLATWLRLVKFTELNISEF